MNNHFKYVIASPCDMENLVCEIYYKDEFFAEITQEGPNPQVNIFSHPTRYWEISLEELQQALSFAYRHLKGEK